ncbi:MAG: ParA family protein [Chloroflexota bacterium]
MAEIIAIANQKGGVGKTTSTLSLGAAFQEMGHKVLLVDLDPQGSLTVSMGYLQPDDLDRTIYDVLRQIVDEGKLSTIKTLPILTNNEGLDLIPSNIELAGIDSVLAGDPAGGNTVLKAALHSAQDAYDFILLDCPPHLGIVSINALTAANRVVIPMAAEYLSMKGLSSLTRTIMQIQMRSNPGLTVGGIFHTMADTRTVHARDVIEITHSDLSENYAVYQTVIPRNVSVTEAPVAGQSILTYNSNSPAAASYRALAKEIGHG